MKIRIITLFKDNLPLLKQYIRSLCACTHYPYELILVDNGSNAETKKELLKLTPSSKNIKIISLNFPVSFSIGNNLAMKLFSDSCDLTILINNDILFTYGWLTEIVEYFEADYNRRGHLVAPLINTNGILYKGGYYDKDKESVRWVKQEESIDPNYLQFCCVAITKEIFLTVGYLPEEYKFYFEDVMYCHRCLLNKIKLVTLDNVIVKHLHAQSSEPEKKKQMMERSKKIFFNAIKLKSK